MNTTPTPEDCIYLKFAGVSGRRLIGMGSAIGPRTIVGAKHASILPGSTVEFPSGERAVVLAKVKAPRYYDAATGAEFEKEAIAAVLDRSIQSFVEPFVLSAPIAFAQHARYASVQLPSIRYIGVTGGTVEHLKTPVDESVEQCYLSFRRLDGQTNARFFDPADPYLLPITIDGPLPAKSGMSGGPSFIDGKVAGVHWTRVSDDFIGYPHLLESWKENAPRTVGGWALETPKHGVLTGEQNIGTVSFEKQSRHGHITTYPCNDAIFCSGRILTFSISEDVTLATYQLTVLFDKDSDGDDDRVKVNITFHVDEAGPPGGELVTVDGSNISYNLGRRSGWDTFVIDLFDLVETAFGPSARIIGHGAFKLRSSGSITRPVLH